MFKIGEFSKLCRVPVSALRYYADIGLLLPVHIDRATGYRYYSLDQLPRLNRILALKDLGLSLEQIARLLDEKVSPEEIRGMLRLRQAEIQQKVDEELARLARVAARLQQIEHEGAMPAQEVVLKQIEPQRVASIREIIGLPEHVATLLAETCGALITNGIQIDAPPYTIFHDDEFKPNDLDIEIAIPVAQPATSLIPLQGGRQLAVREMPAIPSAASTIHLGDYDRLLETYSALGQWIETSGYQIAGPPHEIYLSAPDSETGTMTEIQYPVKKA